MAKRAQLADGTILEFPDETSDLVMDRAVKNYVQENAESKSKSTPMPTLLESVQANPLYRGLRGAAQGAVGTALGIAHMATPKSWGIRAPADVPGLRTDEGDYAGRAGKAIEQTAEFFLPSGAAKKGVSLLASKVPSLTKSGELATKAILEGAGMGALSKAQGASPGASTFNAALGAASPYAGVAVKAASETWPAVVVNNMLRPLLKQFRFGKNAGQGVVDEGIFAWSKSRLADKIEKAKRAVGRKIGNVLNQPKPMKTASGAFMMPPTDPGTVSQIVLDDPLIKSVVSHETQNIPRALLTPPKTVGTGAGRFVSEFEQGKRRLLPIVTRPNIAPGVSAESVIASATKNRGFKSVSMEPMSGKTAPSYPYSPPTTATTVNIREVPTAANANPARVADSLEQAKNRQLIDAINAERMIDPTELIGPIDEALAEASKAGSLAPDNLIDELKKVKDFVLLNPKTGQPRGMIAPVEAQEINRQIGQHTYWTGGAAYEKPLNAAKAQTYGRIARKIKRRVPEVGPLNSHYANLLEAGSSAERGANANPNLRMSEIGLGALGEGLMPHAGISAILTALAGRTAPGATALAQAIKHSQLPAKTLKDLVAAWVSQNAGRNSQRMNR